MIPTLADVSAHDHGQDASWSRSQVTTSSMVAILLSTFDGAKYLGDQLSSFTAQTHRDWRLYWRDDGSSDDSAAIMEAFAMGAGQGRCLRHNGSGHLGAAASFLALMVMAVSGPAAYFAFSDQDDVWTQDKLAHGVAALCARSPREPALYFCARTLADERLVPLKYVPPPRRTPGFPAALTQNVAPGCCMIINRAAAELVGRCPIAEGTWHDWWSYIVVAASDGAIIAGESPDVLYRQHGGNLIGEKLDRWHRGVSALLRGRATFLALFWRHVATIRAWDGPLSEQTRARLAVIERGRSGGLFDRIKALRTPGLVRQTLLETQIFRLWFLWG